MLDLASFVREQPATTWQQEWPEAYGFYSNVNPGVAHPRFSQDNLQHNLRLVEAVKEIARAHDVTPAQIALGWVLRQGNDIVPIPGTKHVRYLEENARAAGLKLPDSAWSALDGALSSFRTAGQRYPEATMKLIDMTE